MNEETKCIFPLPDILEISPGKPNGVWFQTIFKSDKGEISLVHLGFNKLYNKPWEIFCLNGNLFDDVERFDTLIDGIEKIKYYLGDT